MKEDFLYSQEEIFQVNETRTSNACRIILVPFGYPKNFKLQDRGKPGHTIVFKDLKEYKIKAISTISIQSPIANCLAQMVYAKSMHEVFEEWKEKYGENIQNEQMVVVVYTPKK